MKKRILALLLSLSFCISILPTALASPIQADGYITDSRMETSSATVVLRHREATAADGMTTYNAPLIRPDRDVHHEAGTYTYTMECFFFPWDC